MYSSGESVGKLWDHFFNVARHCIHCHVRHRPKNTRKTSPWTTRDIIHLKRLLKRRLFVSSQSGILYTYSIIKDMSQELKQLIRLKKKFYSTALVSFLSSAPSKFCKYINPPSTVGTDNTLDRAQSLNTFFYYRLY